MMLCIRNICGSVGVTLVVWVGVTTLHRTFLTAGPIQVTAYCSLVAWLRDDNFSVWQNVRSISAYHVVKPRIQNYALDTGRENTKRRKFAFNVRHEVYVNA
jgi:hypothetical protein